MQILFIVFIFIPCLTWGGIHETFAEQTRPSDRCAPYVQNDAWKFRYGKHYPNGKSATDFIYSPEGTWRKMTRVEYKWNYYGQYANAKHPFDRNALVAYSRKEQQTTARDANGHLLLDFDHDGEIDNTGDGQYAFIEHSARGLGGKLKGDSFNQFWYDDNFLARYLSQAYEKTEPYGLSAYDDFTRWSVLGGGTENWVPYSDENFDQLALNGLYFLAKGDTKTAHSMWQKIIKYSGTVYDKENQQYTYPQVHENYHLALIKIFAEHLLDLGETSCSEKTKILQHAVSLKSALIQNQQDGKGWISNIGDPNSLMNTESISLGALALGAMSHQSFEPGKEPMHQGEGNYFLRPYSALSAVVGKSKAGLMQSGPSVKFKPGKQHIDFYLRAPHPCAETAKLEVKSSPPQSTLLASKDVSHLDLNGSNQWTKITLPIEITTETSLDFQVHWPGKCNLDLGSIRIR